MNIVFKKGDLRKICNESKTAQRKLGSVRAKRLRKRLDEFRAADSLEDIRYMPQARCHELTGRQKGQLSVDLQHPHTLVFEPADNPIPRKQDGGLDWKNVKSVRILGVEDTHDKKTK